VRFPSVVCQNRARGNASRIVTTIISRLDRNHSDLKRILLGALGGWMELEAI
jgi:hypothetical protein